MFGGKQEESQGDHLEGDSSDKPAPAEPSRVLGEEEMGGLEAGYNVYRGDEHTSHSSEPGEPPPGRFRVGHPDVVGTQNR